MPRDGCPNIAGTYRDYGRSEYRQASGTDLSLSYWLLPLLSTGSADAEVRIAHPEAGRLRVQIVLDSVVVADQVLSRADGDFQCDADGVWTKPVVTSVSDGTGYGRSSISMGFRPAEGGTLAGQQRNDGLGLALWIVPIGATQTIWYRWDRPK